MSGVNFDKDSAKRIARAVRKVESSSLGGGPGKRARARGGNGEKDHLMGAITDHTAARPEGYAQFTWITTEEPTNWTANDVWIKKPS